MKTEKASIQEAQVPWRYGGLPSACLFLLLALFTSDVAQADVPFQIVGPGVVADDFRLTTFADGLNFPVGMVELSDGSILVGVSSGSEFFGSTTGSLMRLADGDGDGVADTRSVLFDGVPGGGLSAVRAAGNLIFATGQGRGKPISILRAGASPSDPLSLVGRIDISYPADGWLHPHSALSVRQTPGQVGSYDLVFQLGSDQNFADTTRNLSLTSDIGVSGALAGDAIHMITITDNGDSVMGSNLTQLATGLRNAAGLAFHPVTGDLYFQDNGIDGFQDVNEPESADELNVIPAGELGAAVEDFGFPDNYTQYRTNQIVGGQGLQPLVAFQPIPEPQTGAEAEGANDIAFASPGFPESLRHGMFVGMHGKFNRGGRANEENPLVFVNLQDNSYFHFIENTEPSVGHLDGLLSTRDSLFVADISPSGAFGRAQSNSGAIYQIKYDAIVIPEPSAITTAMLGLLGMLLTMRQRRSVGNEKSLHGTTTRRD